MAIKKDHDGNALKKKFGYWRYAGVLRIEKDLIINGYGDEPQLGVTIKLEGYDSIEHRELVKQGLAQCEFHHEFIICNWRELKQDVRPATVAEKKEWYAARGAVPEWSDAEWKDLQHDVVTKQEVIEHKDYDRFMLAIGTKEEAEVAYDIFKTHKFSADFYEGAVDV
jgi:hypothetical protein